MKRQKWSVIICFMVFALSLSHNAAAFEEREINFSEIPLSLEQAVNQAKKNNRELKASVHDFNISQRKISETRSEFGFKFSVDGNWQRVHDSSSFAMATYQPTDISGYFAPGSLTVPAGTPIYVANPMPTIIQVPISAKQSRTMDLTITKPLLTFGTKPESIRLQRRARDVQELEVERVELEITLKTKEAFFNFLLAKRNLDVMKKNLSLAEEHLYAARKRFEEGTIPNFDKIRAKVGVTEAREKLTSSETAVELTRMVFNNVIGMDVERPTDVKFSAEDAKSISLKAVGEYINFALKNRLETRQIQLAQEQARIGGRLSKNRPMVSLAIMRNLINSGSAFSSQNTWRYVVAYQTDIYDSGLSHARVAQAKEQEQKLKLSEKDLREGIILQTQQAYLNLIEAQKRLETSKAIMMMAAEARKMADVGHEQGVTSEIDWKDALFGELQAGLNLAKTEFDLEMAKANLAYAIGVQNIDDF